MTNQEFIDYVKELLKKLEEECDGNCGCDGKCGDNCKCKDK